MSDNKYYITTPIYYANDVPHIGHTGTTVFADIIARYQRISGKEVFFLTGNDEHGEKVALAAQKVGESPQQFVDELALEWQKYWEKLNISNDHFFRTTAEGHKKVVHDLLTKLWEKGDIYKDVYKGIYCVGCEEFKAEKDLVDGKCPEHRPDQVYYREEENYFFRITKYLPEVKKLIESGEFIVEPDNKRNEMLSRLSGDINDLSISRPNLKWGITIPWDENHVTYVWVEALMNYYSATKICNKEDFWPANVHFVGKGINWFHSVIWPSMLLALELPLPKKVFVHGYYNVDGKKMGKSLGNVISPQDLLEKYGVDGTRYLLCASMPYENDSDVSFTWFDQKYNADLANGLGNLVSRVAKLAEGQTFEVVTSVDLSIYEKFKLHEVVSYSSRLVAEANEYLNKEEPWKKSGDQKNTVLKEVIGKIVDIARLLEPITPEASGTIIRTFSGKLSISPVSALYLRI